jgi:hypothetical protein
MRLEGWATCLVVAHLSAGITRAIETRQSAGFTPRDAGAPQGEVVWFHLFGMYAAAMRYFAALRTT